jgi:long-subunit acyl-CoA synthetase (AMP-forming)
LGQRPESTRSLKRNEAINAYDFLGIGELHVPGPSVMLGFYRERDLTAAAVDSEGWVRQVTFSDRQRCLYIVERAKEMIY